MTWAIPTRKNGWRRHSFSRWIDKQIQVRGLNQTQAAELLGMSQPDVSKLVRGRVAGFSLERLARMINALGHDVRISVAASGGPGAGALAGICLIATSLWSSAAGNR